jgi:hypothetical protein
MCSDSSLEDAQAESGRLSRGYTQLGQPLRQPNARVHEVKQGQNVAGIVSDSLVRRTGLPGRHHEPLEENVILG